MPDAALADWRRSRADGVPLPEGPAQEAMIVEVDDVTVGGALLEYVEDGGTRCFVRVLQTTLPPEANAAWAAVVAALEECARARGAVVLTTAVPPQFARAFGDHGFLATMTTVGKRLSATPFAPELQVDQRVSLRPMTSLERRRLSEEGLAVMLPGMERAGVADRGSPRLSELEARLARLGDDPAPDDELLLTAVVGDQAVGRFWATTVRHEDGGLDVFGNLVELFPEHRGQGLTKSLLGAVRRHLHHLGVRDLQLRVLGHDAGAGRTFRTAGYGVADVHLRKDLR
jgi:GNAT superfamily N-acetyltransferase